MLLKDKRESFLIGDSPAFTAQKNVSRAANDRSLVVQAMYNSGLIDEEEMRTHPNKNLLSAIIGDYSQNHPVRGCK